MADIILIVIIAFFAYMGAKRGLIKTLFGAVSTLISLVLSMLLYRPVSELLYNSTFGDSIKEFAGKLLAERMEQTAQLFLLDKAVETTAVLVMNVISFVIVIVAVKLIVIILANVLNIASKLPVIKQANKLFGMVAGALSGILVCYIIIGIVAALGGEENLSALQESIKNSVLAVNMYDNNLIKDVLSGFIK